MDSPTGLTRAAGPGHPTGGEPAGGPRASALGAAIGLTAGFVVVQVVAVFIGAIVGMALTDTRAADLADTRTAGGLVALLIGEMLLAGVVVVFAQRQGAAARIGLGPRGAGRSIGQALPVAIAFAALPLGALLASGDDVVRADIGPERAAMLVAFAIAVAIAEEVAFRGLVLERLGGAARPAFATTWSAALFGALHMPFGSEGGGAEIVNAAAVTLAVGVPLALVRLRSGSLVGPIVAHALIDIFGLLHLGSLELPDVKRAEAIVELAIALLLATGYAFWYRQGGPATTGTALEGRQAADPPGGTS